MNVIMVDVADEYNILDGLANVTASERFTQYVTSGRIFADVCKCWNGHLSVDELCVKCVNIHGNAEYTREVAGIVVDIIAKINTAIHNALFNLLDIDHVQFNGFLPGSTVIEIVLR